jgi:glutaredoxin
MTPSVVLYGREGCCLCDDAREILLRVRDEHPFALDERDIETDERLLKAYLERIPVVTLDGVEVFELFVDERELTRLIAGRPAPDRRTADGRVESG